MSCVAFEPWIGRFLAWQRRLSIGGQAGLDQAAKPLEPSTDPQTRRAAPAHLQPVNPTVTPAFNQLALDLFSLQFQHVKPYRRWCEFRGMTPDQVSDWSDIPCVPAAGFKEFDLTSLPPAERTTIFHSSGTSGRMPARHYHSAESLQLYECSLEPWFTRHLLPEQRGMRVLALAPSTGAAPHSSLAYMLSVILDRHGTPHSFSAGHVGPQGSWEIDPEGVVTELQSVCAAEEPLLLLGTAFGFVHLLEAFHARTLRLLLPPGSRIMETGGYKGRSRALPRPKLYAALTRDLGIPDEQIVSEYGMSELSSQAYDRQAGSRARRTFRFPPWCRPRVVSPETGLEAGAGEVGLLQVFDLANVFSVLAIQTEDLAVAHPDGFDYVGRARGSEVRGCSLMHP